MCYNSNLFLSCPGQLMNAYAYSGGREVRTVVFHNINFLHSGLTIWTCWILAKLFHVSVVHGCNVHGCNVHGCNAGQNWDFKVTSFKKYRRSISNISS